MKRTVSLALALIMCISILSSLGLVSARFDDISTMGVGLSIDSNGKATCAGSFDLYDNNQYAELSVELQQYKNGVWIVLKTWTSSGTGAGGASGSYYVLKGYSYRAATTVTVYDYSGNIVESVTKESRTKTY